MSPTELDTRLRALETQMAALTQLVSSHLAKLDDLVAKHDRVLFGTFPEDENSLGLITKTDRLWETLRRSRWYLRALGGAMFTLIGAAAAHFLGF